MQLHRNFPTVTFIIAVVTAVMGAATVYLGWWMMADSVTFQAASRPFEARVVSVERYASSGNGAPSGSTTGGLPRDGKSVTFRPTVAFTDDIGVWEEQTENLSQKFDFEIGTTVPIRFIPGNPPRVRIDTKEYPFVAFGLFAVLGGGFLIGGGIVAARAYLGWRAFQRIKD